MIPADRTKLTAIIAIGIFVFGDTAPTAKQACAAAENIVEELASRQWLELLLDEGA